MFRKICKMSQKELKKYIAKEQYVGIIQTTWAPTTDGWREELFAAADLMKEVQ